MPVMEASLAGRSASDMSEEQRGSAQTRDGAVPLGEKCGQIGRPPVRSDDLEDFQRDAPTCLAQKVRSADRGPGRCRAP